MILEVLSLVLYLAVHLYQLDCIRLTIGLFIPLEGGNAPLLISYNHEILFPSLYGVFQVNIYHLLLQLFGLHFTLRMFVLGIWHAHKFLTPTFLEVDAS